MKRNLNMNDIYAHLGSESLNYVLSRIFKLRLVELYCRL